MFKYAAVTLAILVYQGVATKCVLDNGVDDEGALPTCLLHDGSHEGNHESEEMMLLQSSQSVTIAELRRDIRGSSQHKRRHQSLHVATPSSTIISSMIVAVLLLMMLSDVKLVMQSLDVDAESLQPHKPGLYRTAASAAIYLFLNGLVFSMQGPAMQKLFLLRSCSEQGLDAAHCQAYVDGAENTIYDQAQKEAAHLESIAGLISGVPLLVGCALLGSLGDAYGRKVPLLLNVIGSTLNVWIWALFESWAVLFTLGAFCSLFGPLWSGNQAAFASLADATQHASSEQRALVFSMVEGCVFIGMTIGPTIGGALADWLGNQPSLFVPAVVGILNFVVTSLTYRETLAHDHRQPLAWKRANPVSSLGMFLKTRTTLMMGSIVFFCQCAQFGTGSVVALYAQKVANANATTLGLLGSTQSVSQICGLMIIMPMLVQCLSLEKILLISCLNGVLCSFLLALSGAVWQLFAGSAGLLLVALIYPVIRCGMTNTFGRSRYGDSLTAVAMMETLCPMLGVPIFNSIYQVSEASEWTVGGLTVRCLAFMAIALFYLVASLGSLLVRDIPPEFDKLDNSRNSADS
mmetsp:Transcript_41950/g.72680  ORF Transcript_41950/g.72680 Transcript_41950/m.72680 type:complete len:576 (-) Transcript_41950:26-1753(-)